MLCRTGMITREKLNLILHWYQLMKDSKLFIPSHNKVPASNGVACEKDQELRHGTKNEKDYRGDDKMY